MLDKPQNYSLDAEEQKGHNVYAERLNIYAMVDQRLIHTVYIFRTTQSNRHNP